MSTLELIDDTVTVPPLPMADVEKERARAQRLYDNGVIGFRRLQSWLRRLDYQLDVRAQVDDSLADAEMVIADDPIGREREEQEVTRRPNRTQTRRVGKFARSL
jgi:hypothetical protein